MEHQIFVLVLALAMTLIVWGMWLLTARTAGLRDGVQGTALRKLAAHLPAAAFVVTAGMMLLDMAADPTAAGLWPLSIAGMLFLWLVYIGVLQTLMKVVRLVRRLG